MIIGPVSRVLAVADVDRTTSFFRDVLGFEVTPVNRKDGVPAATASSGPALIEFARTASAPDSTFEDQPRGTAVLFFPVDDVKACHKAIGARGGAPSRIAKLSHLKQSVFEVRDPDGHVYWFGQTFAEAVEEKEPGQVREFLPELPVSDLAKAVAYYQDVLGFRVNYADQNIGVMFRDDGTLLLMPRDREHSGIGSFYAYIRDADALHAELVAKGATVLGAPVSKPWGLRDFSVLDLEGNRLTFGQAFE